MKVNIQVSLYPLGTEKLGEKIMDAIQVLRDANLETHTNPMSTIISCELDDGMSTLGKMFEHIAKNGQAVMTVTVSNACG